VVDDPGIDEKVLAELMPTETGLVHDDSCECEGSRAAQNAARQMPSGGANARLKW